MALLCALGLLLLAQAGGESAPSAPPKAPVAGMTGLSIVSELTLAQDDEATRRLSATYVFPARARLQIVPLEGPANQRDTIYRFGDRHWALSPGRTRSRDLDDKEFLFAPLHIELRRALWLWPDGFEWKESESNGKRLARASVEVPISVPRARCPPWSTDTEAGCSTRCWASLDSRKRWSSRRTSPRARGGSCR